MLGIAMAERGFLPDPLIRVGIRRLLRNRLASESARSADLDSALDRFVRDMARSEVLWAKRTPFHPHPVKSAALAARRS